jgi:hypothetical protein
MSRRYLYTVTADDIGRGSIKDVYGKSHWLSGYFGLFERQDIGKRLYDIDGVVQMENNEQRDRRLAKEHQS